MLLGASPSGPDGPKGWGEWKPPLSPLPSPSTSLLRVVFYHPKLMGLSQEPEKSTPPPSPRGISYSCPGCLTPSFWPDTSPCLSALFGRDKPPCLRCQGGGSHQSTSRQRALASLVPGQAQWTVGLVCWHPWGCVIFVTLLQEASSSPMDLPKTLCRKS